MWADTVTSVTPTAAYVEEGTIRQIVGAHLVSDKADWVYAVDVALLGTGRWDR